MSIWRYSRRACMSPSRKRKGYPAGFAQDLPFNGPVSPRSLYHTACQAPHSGTVRRTLGEASQRDCLHCMQTGGPLRTSR